MQPCPQNAPHFKSYENRVSLTGYLGLLLLLTGIFFTGCESVVDADEDDEKEVERSYSKSIEREYDNEFERSLIDSAEAVYPPRDSVLSAVSDNNRDHIPETNYWFYRSIDQVLIPFAITAEAVDYYSTLIDSMKAGITHQFINSAEFEYRTSISFEEEYEFNWPEELVDSYIERTGEQPPEETFHQVYVVKKKIRWEHRCVEHCGLWLKRDRVVIINKNNDIKRVFLDGGWWVPKVL